MATQEQVEEIHKLYYDILGRGSHSESECASAKLVATLVVLFTPLIENNNQLTEILIRNIDNRQASGHVQ